MAEVRCFLALDLPAPVRNHLAAVAGNLRRYDIKWVPAHQLHVTLLFAGELPEQNLEQLCELVRAIDVPPLELSLHGLGHFPPRGMPRVVYAGLAGDIEPMTALQHEVDERARPLGVPREKRGFVPHITLGRIQSQFGALALIDELKAQGAALQPKPFAATELVLYSSQLRPGGPQHDPLVRRPVPKKANTVRPDQVTPDPD